MSNELLNQLKEHIGLLTPEEKKELAKFLSEQTEANQPPGATETSTSSTDSNARAVKRAQHLAWLKSHREQYAGQYVALDGDRLVGCGASIREAHEQARQQGIENPFLVHVSSENDAPFGGW
jgi:uncharacterized protein DUF5678